MFQEITGPYIVMVGACLLYLLFSITSGWRAFVGWVVFLSVQLPLNSETIRPAISDLFIPFAFLAWVFAGNKRAEISERQGRSQLLPWILVFTALFFGVGNTIAYIHLGYIPIWTIVNKDIGLITLVMMFALSEYYIRDKERLFSLIRYFIYTGFAINAVALCGGIARYALGINNPMMRDTTGLRLVGFNINPGSFGGWLIVIILIQLSLLLGQSKIIGMRRSLQWANLIVGCLDMVMTLSRSSYLGFSAGLFAVIFLSKKGSAKNIIVIGTLVLLSMTYLFRHSQNSDLDEQFQSSVYRSDTAEQRVTMNETAISLFFESPVNIPFGIGIGTFLMRSAELLGHYNQIHNTFLWILVEMGACGFVVMLMIFYRAYADCRTASRLNWSGRPLAIGVIASIIGSLGWFMGDEGLWHRHIWFVFILADAVYRIYLQEIDFKRLVEGSGGHPEFTGNPAFVAR